MRRRGKVKRRRVVNDKHENDESEDEEEDADSTDFDNIRSSSSDEDYADSDEDSDVGTHRSRKDKAREDVKSRGFERIGGGRPKKNPKVNYAFLA